MPPTKRKSSGDGGGGGEDAAAVSNVAPGRWVTRGLTRQLLLNSDGDSAPPPPPPPKKKEIESKKPKKETTEKESETTTLKTETTIDEGAKMGTSVGVGSKSPTIVIEHCKQCHRFKVRAAQVQKGLEAGVPGVTVLVNPEKPRRGCFEIRLEGGQTFISLLDMKRPFKPMTDLDMEEVIADIIGKIKA